MSVRLIDPARIYLLSGSYIDLGSGSVANDFTVSGTLYSSGGAVLYGPLVVSSSAFFSGTVEFTDLIVSGNLTVLGTETILNTDTLRVEDKTIELAVVPTPSDLTAQGAGIIITGSTNKSFLWNLSGFQSSDNIDLFVNKYYAIGGDNVLSHTALGSSVINSSLQTLGNITSGTWNSSPITGSFSGTLYGIATTASLASSSANIVTAGTFLGNNYIFSLVSSSIGFQSKYLELYNSSDAKIRFTNISASGKPYDIFTDGLGSLIIRDVNADINRFTIKSGGDISASSTISASSFYGLVNTSSYSNTASVAINIVNTNFTSSRAISASYADKVAGENVYNAVYSASRATTASYADAAKLYLSPPEGETLIGMIESASMSISSSYAETASYWDSAYWKVNDNGMFIPLVTNIYDIGTDLLRPRTIYVNTSLISHGAVSSSLGYQIFGNSINSKLYNSASLVIETTTNDDVLFRTNNTNRWVISKAGILYSSIDNTYDIGTTAIRPRFIYIASGSVIGPDPGSNAGLRVGTDFNVDNILYVDSTNNLIYLGSSTSSINISDTTQIESSATSQLLGLVKAGNNSNGAYLSFYKSRGTSLTQTGSVSSNDEIGIIRFAGMPTNGIYSVASTIKTVVNNAYSDRISSQLIFSTIDNSNSGSIQNRLIIDDWGVVTIKSSSVSNSPLIVSGNILTPNKFVASASSIIVELDNNAVGTYTDNVFNLKTNNVNKWAVSSSGHLLAVSDNLYDIGQPALNRPRNLYVVGEIIARSFTGSFTGSVTIATSSISATTSSYGNNNFIIFADPGGTETLRVSGAVRSSNIKLGISGTLSAYGGVELAAVHTSSLYIAANAYNFYGTNATTLFWQISSSGHLLPGTNNIYDIGSPVNSVRDIRSLGTASFGIVGINTTIPSPGVLLDVNGSVGIRSANYLYFGYIASASGWTTRQYASTSTHVFNATNYSFTNEGYVTPVTTSLYISGNASIGVNTNAPRSTLYIVGSDQTTNRHIVFIASGSTYTPWNSYTGVSTTALQIQTNISSSLILVPNSTADAQLIVGTGSLRISTNAIPGTNAGTLGMTIDNGSIVIPNAITATSITGSHTGSLTGQLTFNSHVLAATDNLYDIGQSALNRPRNLYVAGEIVASRITGSISGTITYATMSTTADTASFITWVNIYNKPVGIVTSSAQVVSLISGQQLNATGYSGTFSGSFIGTSSWASRSVSSSYIQSSNIQVPFLGTPDFKTGRDLQDAIWSAGTLVDRIFVTRVDSSHVTVSSGSGLIRTINYNSGTLVAITWPASSSISVPFTGSIHLGVEYNGGTPRVAIKNTFDWNWNTEFPLAKVYHDGTDVIILKAAAHSEDVANHTRQFLRQVLPFSRTNGVEGGGLIIGELGTRNISMTAGKVWHGFNHFEISAIDTSAGGTFTTWWRGTTTPISWSMSSSQTQWPNGQYDTGTGLGNLSPSKYGVLWCYLDVATSKLHIIYGRGNHSNVGQAEAEAEPNTVPIYITERGFLLARLIFQQGALTLYSISTIFDTVFQNQGITSHDDLSGLQGGTTGQYFHLTSAEYVGAGSGIFVRQTNTTLSGSLTGSLTGSLLGTSSYAISASYAPTLGAFDATVVRGYSGSFTGSVTGSLLGTSSYASSGSYSTLINIPIGIVSSSGQISYTALSNIPIGIVSSSTQTSGWSAATLTTPRLINGTSFDGSSNIIITASYSTLTNIPVGIVSSSTQTSGWSAATLTTPRLINGTSFDGGSNIIITASYSTLTNIPVGIVSSSAQTTALLPVGTVSSSAQATGWTVTTATGNAGTATTLQTARLINGTSFNGSANIIITASYSTLTEIPIGIISSSTQASSWTVANANTLTTARLINGTSFNGSSNIIITASYSTLTSIPIGIVSSSTQTSGWSAATLTTPRLINGTSFDGSSNIIITASYSTLTSIPVGIVSSSGQISYTGLSNIPIGIVSSSTQASAWAVGSAAILTTARLINGTSFDGSSNIIITSSYSTLTSVPVGIVSSSAQVTALLPVGTVSGSGQVSYTNLTNIPIGIVSSSGQVSYTGLSNIPVGIVSSSAQTTALLPVGTVSSSTQASGWTVSAANTLSTGRLINGTSFNGSTNIIITASYSTLTEVPVGIVSSSTQASGWTVSSANTLTTARLINGTSFNGSANIIITASYATLTSIPIGIVSSSTQTSGWSAATLTTARLINGTSFDGSSNIIITASYGTLTSVPVGIVSSSAQVTALLPIGSVSSSGQISYTGLSNIPIGIVSSSAQTTALLPVGTVSSSAQASSWTVASSSAANNFFIGGTLTTIGAASHSSGISIVQSAPSASISAQSSYVGTATNDFIKFGRTGWAIYGTIGYNALTTDYLYIGTMTSHPFAIRTNNTVALYADASQNIGIGVTTNPTKLTVYTAAGTSISSSTAGGTGWAGEFRNIDGGGNREVRLAGATYAATFISGNVGIGTITPTMTLTIASGSQTTLDVQATLTGGTAKLKLNPVNNTFWTIETNGSTDALQFTRAGSELVRITSAGTYITGSVNITSALTAQTKSFLISHKTKPGKKLMYGVLEGPEHAVYTRGRLTKSKTIHLPDEWKWLVDETTMTVQLTPIGSHQKLYVEEIKNNKVIIVNGNIFNPAIDCYYYIQATRKDVPKLETVV